MVSEIVYRGIIRVNFNQTASKGFNALLAYFFKKGRTFELDYMKLFVISVHMFYIFRRLCI